MLKSGFVKKLLAGALSFCVLVSAIMCVTFVKADSYAVTKTYMNTFDNEASLTNPDIHSIEDIYSYYDYAPSAYTDDYTVLTTRAYKQIDFAQWRNKNTKAEPHIDPAYIAGESEYVSYGKDSPGSMFLGYTTYTPQTYSRFRIWNNQSTNEPFVLWDNGAYRAKQALEATNSTTIYRISFDYKAELPNGVDASLCYYNASGDEWYLGDVIDNSTSTELVSVKNTNGEWVFSGYTYVQSSAWRVASIALKAPLAYETIGTKVWIDNLKVEVIDVSPDAIVTLTFKDGNNTLYTLNGLAGMDYSVSNPTKEGFNFVGWLDANGNPVESSVFPSTNTTYTAKWEEKGYTLSKTYINTFDNESSVTDPNIHSIEDVYSYYDFAPSAYNGTKLKRNSKGIGISYGGTFNAEPYIDLEALIDGDDSTVPEMLGKDSYGSMLLSYPSVQVTGNYARFRVWDNQSEKTLFASNDKPTQVIEASNANTVYRISFDYKAEVPEGYSGALYYFNGQNGNYFAAESLEDSRLSKLVNINDTAGEWVHSGYTYVQSTAWQVVSIALKMDENIKSAGTKVFIDNLKVEVTDATSLDQLATLTFKDGNKVLHTFKGIKGVDTTPYVAEPEKYGYDFIGWSTEYTAGADFPKDSITYTAQWQVKPGISLIEVTYNYGQNDSRNTTSEAAVGAVIVNFPEIPQKQGYLFSGWYDEDNNYYNEDTLAPANDITLTALWVKIPDRAEDFATSFEEDDFTDYSNVNSFGKLSSFNTVDAGISTTDSDEGGKNSIIIKNTDFVKYNAENRPAIALVKSDGTPFVVKKGVRYTIKFSAKALGSNGEDRGASYIVPAVSSELAENVGASTVQDIHKKYIYCLETVYTDADVVFEADRDGFLYFTIHYRGGTSEAFSKDHMASIDDVSVTAEKDAVKVDFCYQNGDNDVNVQTVYGIAGEELDFIPGPERTGYEFGGWFTNSSLTKKATVFPDEDSKYYAKFTQADYSNPETLKDSFTLGFGDDGENEDEISLFYQSKNNNRLKSDMEVYENEVVHGDSENAHSGDSYMKLNYLPQCHISPDSAGMKRETYMLIYNPEGKYNKTWIEPNTSYRLSFWYKPMNDFDISGFYVAFVNLNDISTPIKYTSIQLGADISKVKGKQWNKIEIVVTSPDVLSCLRLSFFRSSAIEKVNGTVYDGYLDDLTVTKLNDYEVSFEMNGGDKLENVTVPSGETIGELSEAPFKLGYVFDGWFADAKLTKSFDIENTPITADTVLYAKWKLSGSEEEDYDDIYESSGENDTSDDYSDSSSSDDISDTVYDDNPQEGTEITQNYGERLTIMEADAVSVTDDAEEDGMALWLIILLSISGLILVAGIVLLIILLLKKKKQRN